MNDMPSPAPHRRRRRQFDQDDPGAVIAPHAQMPSHEDAQGEDAQGEDQLIAAQREIVRRRRQNAAPNARAADKRRRAVSPLSALPGPLRAVIAALMIIALFICAVCVTRSYLAAQQERRRLEAEAAERAQHPLYYADLIVQYALAQELDPALVSAVILCESSFNPQAESRLGARGLMQLMEDTAQWVAHKLGEDGEGYTFDLLYDPETNIRFGTWYLGYLSRRFDADPTKIVCAYHAGQGNVDSWLSNPKYSADGVTLDTIPTQDTATYAARVLGARDVYRKHYFPAPTPMPALTDSSSTSL